MSQNYDSPQSELSEIEPNEIHHQSNLLMRDLMFGTFFTQLSMGVNKALFLFLAIFSRTEIGAVYLISWG